MQYRLLPTRVAEGHILEFDRSGYRPKFDRIRGVGDRRLRLQNGLEPPRAGDGPRDEDQDEHRHHHREHDLQDVGEEGDQVADRHLAAVDQVSPEPDDGDAGEIHDGQQRRQRHGEDPVDAQGRCGQVGIDRLESIAFVGNAVEGTDDPNPGDLLAEHLGDPVDLLLQRLEEGNREVHQDGEDRDHQRQDHDQDG